MVPVSQVCKTWREAADRDDVWQLQCQRKYPGKELARKIGGPITRGGPWKKMYGALELSNRSCHDCPRKGDHYAQRLDKKKGIDLCNRCFEVCVLHSHKRLLDKVLLCPSCPSGLKEP